MYNENIKITAIASCGLNFEMGKDNDLVFRSKADMSFFKESTVGTLVVMGRKTYESIPAKLEDRTVAVLSSTGLVPNLHPNDVVIVPKSVGGLLRALKRIASSRGYDRIVIAGGASVYELFAPYVDEVYITTFNKTDPDADVFFPHEEYSNVALCEYRRVVLTPQDVFVRMFKKHNTAPDLAITDYFAKGKGQLPVTMPT